MVIGGCGDRNIETAAVPEIGNRNPAAVGDEICSGGCSDFRKRSIAVVAEMPVAFPSMPRRAAKILGIEEDSSLVVFLPANDIVEKVQLDLGVAIVVNPPVCGVNVLPAIVVEVCERRAPEPSDRVRIRFPGYVFKGAVSLIPQQCVP